MPSEKDCLKVQYMHGAFIAPWYMYVHFMYSVHLNVFLVSKNMISLRPKSFEND